MMMLSIWANRGNNLQHAAYPKSIWSQGIQPIA